MNRCMESELEWMLEIISSAVNASFRVNSKVHFILDIIFCFSFRIDEQLANIAKLLKHWFVEMRNIAEL